MTEQQMLAVVLEEIGALKQLVERVLPSQVASRPHVEKELITVTEAAELLGVKPSYIYRLTHEKRIPHHKPGGNRVLFERQDVLSWARSNRVKPQDEVSKEAANHLAIRRRGAR